MSYTFEIKIVVDSDAEASNILRMLRSSGRSELKTVPCHSTNYGKQVLKMIQETREEGIFTSEMAALLGIPRKGIGGVMTKLRRSLYNLGFNPDRVFTDYRTRKGRKWFARRDIDSAVRSLE